MGQLRREDKECFFYADYLQWAEGSWELIDGVVYDMTPAPSRQHQKISGDLFAIIHSHLKKDPCEVYAAPFDVRFAGDVCRTADNEITTVVQPDIVIICDPGKLDDRGCLGAPDLIVEILSPSTAARDLKIKRDLYEKHRVKEYWVVHPVDKIFMIYKLGEDGFYQKADVFSGADIITSTTVKGVDVKLEDIFGTVIEKEFMPHMR